MNRLVITAETFIDGTSLYGPCSVTLDVAHVIPFSFLITPGSGSYQELNVGSALNAGKLRALILMPTKIITVKVQGASNEITVSAGGIFMLANFLGRAGAMPQVANGSVDDATLNGFLAGDS